MNDVELWAKKSLESHRSRKKGRGKIGIDLPLLVELANNSPKCAICGIDLDYSRGKGRVQSNSPTVDRIDNGSVTSLGDIHIVCWDCNVMKGSKPFELFLQKCAKIARRARRKGLLC